MHSNLLFGQGILDCIISQGSKVLWAVQRNWYCAI